MSWCLEIAWNTDLEDQQNFISLSWLSWHSRVFFFKVTFHFLYSSVEENRKHPSLLLKFCPPQWLTSWLPITFSGGTEL